MVTMSQKEFQRVKVIENAAGGRLSVGEASRLLQLSERQVQRLKGRYQPDSIGWVQHGNRGRSMPWAVSLPQKQLILQLARGKYQGFNDSHLAEKLRAEENLMVSRETVRRILRAAKLASPPTSASTRSPPPRRKPRAASNASGAPARTVWSATSASSAPPPCSTPILCSPSSVPTTTSASPAPPPMPLATSAPCHAASIFL